MSDNRKEERKNAKTFFGIYSKPEGTLIGYLIDLTKEGMKIKSLHDIKSGIDYEFRMELPFEIEKINEIIFLASCKWSKKCPDSRYFESGFAIIDTSPETSEQFKILLASKLFSSEADKLHISLSMVAAKEKS